MEIFIRLIGLMASKHSVNRHVQQTGSANSINGKPKHEGGDEPNNVVVDLSSETSNQMPQHCNHPRLQARRSSVIVTPSPRYSTVCQVDNTANDSQNIDSTNSK